MEDKKFNHGIKLLGMCLIVVLLACFFGFCEYRNDRDAAKDKQQYEEAADSEKENAAEENADAEDAEEYEEEPVEVDENGIPTEKGYQQILEQDREKGLKEEEERMLREAEEAYKKEMEAENAQDAIDEAPSGVNGRMDL